MNEEVHVGTKKPGCHQPRKIYDVIENGEVIATGTISGLAEYFEVSEEAVRGWRVRVPKRTRRFTGDYEHMEGITYEE